MAQSWNAELARAAEARVCYFMSIGSTKEFMWRKTHATILSVEKDIKKLPSGRIVNMPRLKEVTAQQELEAIIRGERPAVPEEMISAIGQPPERDFNQHPYLKRMQYRGGGYAILLAMHLWFRRPGARQFMYKSELIRQAQTHCDVSMGSDGWGKSATSGWASHRSILAHRLAMSSKSNGKNQEEFRLTDDGKLFIEAMIRRWPLSEIIGNPQASTDTEPKFNDVTQLEMQQRQRQMQVTPPRDRGIIRAAPTPLSGVRKAQRCRESAIETSADPLAIDGSRPTRDAAPEGETNHIWPSSGTARICGRVATNVTQHPAEAVTAQSVSKSPCASVMDLLHTASVPRCGGASSEKWASINVSSDEEDLPRACALGFSTPDCGSELTASWCAHVTDVNMPACAGEHDTEVISRTDTVGVCGASESDTQVPRIRDKSREVSACGEAPSPLPHDGSSAILNCQPAAVAHFSEVDSVVRLLVDDRERLRDADPRGLYERIRSCLCSQRGHRGEVVRHRLRFGDFAWVAGKRGEPQDRGRLLRPRLRRRKETYCGYCWSVSGWRSYETIGTPRN